MEVVKHYSITDASQLLGCDVETVLAWIHSGELVAVNICRSMNKKRPTWRIAESELGLFLLRRRSQPAEVQATAPKRTKRPSPRQFV